MQFDFEKVTMWNYDVCDLQLNISPYEFRNICAISVAMLEATNTIVIS